MITKMSAVVPMSPLRGKIIESARSCADALRSVIASSGGQRDNVLLDIDGNQRAGRIDGYDRHGQRYPARAARKTRPAGRSGWAT